MSSFRWISPVRVLAAVTLCAALFASGCGGGGGSSAGTGSGGGGFVPEPPEVVVPAQVSEEKREAVAKVAPKLTTPAGAELPTAPEPPGVSHDRRILDTNPFTDESARSRSRSRGDNGDNPGPSNPGSSSRSAGADGAIPIPGAAARNAGRSGSQRKVYEFASPVDAPLMTIAVWINPDAFLPGNTEPFIRIQIFITPENLALAEALAQLDTPPQEEVVLQEVPEAPPPLTMVTVTVTRLHPDSPKVVAGDSSGRETITASVGDPVSVGASERTVTLEVAETLLERVTVVPTTVTAASVRFVVVESEDAESLSPLSEVVAVATVTTQSPPGIEVRVERVETTYEYPSDFLAGPDCPSGTMPDKGLLSGELNATMFVKALKNDIAGVCEYLRRGANVNTEFSEGTHANRPVVWTVLMEAASEGWPDLAKLLHANGADVHARGRWGFTPLHWASSAEKARRDEAGRNYPMVVEFLLSVGASVNAASDENFRFVSTATVGSSPLDAAAFVGDEQSAAVLREHGGVCFHSISPLCGTSVASCTAAGFVLAGEVCASECPADEFNVGGECLTPTAAACSGAGYLLVPLEEVCVMECPAGYEDDGEGACVAAVTAGTVCASGTLSSDGMSRWRLAKELRKAVKANDLNLACTMLRRGANVNDGNEQSNTPLHFAADRGYLEMAAFLLANGADADDRGKWSQTPLHFAAKRHYLTLVTLLIGRGADVNALKDKPQGADKTPLDLVQRLDPEVVSDAEAVASALREAGGVCFARTGSLCGTATAGRCAAAGAVLAGSVCASGCSDSEMNVDGECVVPSVASCSAGELLLSPLEDACVSACPAGYESDSEGACVLAAMAATICEAGDLPANGMTQAELDAGMLAEVRDNDVEGVCEYLRRGANVDARNGSPTQGQTALMAAAEEGLLELAELLLVNGADVNAKRRGVDGTPLHLAAYQGHLAVAELLLDHGAAVNEMNGEGGTPLHEAALFGAHREGGIMKLLLDRGAAVDARNMAEETPLHLAARWWQSPDVVKLLLDRGAAVNATDAAQMTPLHYAAAGPRFPVVELLLDRGAAVNVRGGADGASPLDGVGERADIAALLRERGGVCFASTSELCGTLVASCSAAGFVLSGDVCAVECAAGKLLSPAKDACISACPAGYENNGEDACGLAAATAETICESGDLPANGMTRAELGAAMLWKARQNDLAGVCEYLRRGADIEAQEDPQTYYNRTALMIAAGRGYLELAKMLHANGANVNAKRGNGWTPLHDATRWGRFAVAEFLLNNGADVNARGSGSVQGSGGGWKATPLHNAALRDNVQMVELLLDRGADVNALMERLLPNLSNPVPHSPLDVTNRHPRHWYRVLHFTIKVADVLREHGGVCFAEVGGPLCWTATAARCSAAGFVLSGEVCASACPADEFNVGGECVSGAVVHFGIQGGGTVSAESGGAALAAGDVAARGATVVFTATPEAGRYVSAWHGDCADGGEVGTDAIDGGAKVCRKIAAPGSRTLSVWAEFGESPSLAGPECPSGTLPSGGLTGDELFARLRTAAGEGDAAKICEWLMRGADVNGTRDGSELTALHEATRQGRLAAVLLLLANGADPNAQKETGGVGPLDVAAFSESDREDEAAALRAAGAICFRATGALCGPQTVASCSAEGLVLNGAVCAGECPEGKTNSNGSCVLSTVASRCGESGEVLSPSEGVCIEVCPAGYVGDGTNCVAATTVCESGTLSAGGLTQAELNVSIVSAAADGDADAVCDWLRKGADIHASSDNFSDLLEMAAFDGDLTLAKLLVANGADVNGKGAGSSPLSWAAFFGYVELAKFLVESGANVNREGFHRLTPLDELAQSKQRDKPAGREIAGYLRSRGGVCNRETHFVCVGPVAVTVTITATAEDPDSPLVIAGDVAGETTVTSSVSAPAVAPGDYSSSLYAVTVSVTEYLLRRVTVVPTTVTVDTTRHVLTDDVNAPSVTVAMSTATVTIQSPPGVEVRVVRVKTWREYPAGFLAGPLCPSGTMPREGWTQEQLDRDLSRAASRGDPEAVCERLRRGANVRGTCEYCWQNPLKLAAENSNVEVAKILIANGADVNVSRYSGSSPLALAVARGRPEMVKILIANGADLASRSAFGGSLLNDAASPIYGGGIEARMEVVKILVSNGADVNAGGYPTTGQTPLHFVAAGRPNGIYAKHAEDQFKMAKLLVSLGADVNAQVEDGGTPIHNAANLGFAKMVKFLIDSGADVNARDGEKGPTPLHKAAHWGYVETAKLLIDSGADVNARDGEKGPTPLHMAARRGNAETAKLLIDSGADINAEDDSWWFVKTPLHDAAYFGNLDVAKLLVAEGADVNGVEWWDKRGITPLHQAVKHRNHAIADFLRANGGDCEEAAKVLCGLLSELAYTVTLTVTANDPNSPLVVAGDSAGWIRVTSSVSAPVEISRAVVQSLAAVTLEVTEYLGWRVTVIPTTVSLVRHVAAGDALLGVVATATATIQSPPGIEVRVERVAVAEDKFLSNPLWCPAGTLSPEGRTQDQLDLALLDETGYHGNAGEVCELLRRGADVNVRGPDGTGPPLIRAVGNYRFRTAKILVANGADVNARSETRANHDWHLTPLTYSILLDDMEMFAFLLDSGARVSGPGVFPLHWAADSDWRGWGRDSSSEQLPMVLSIIRMLLDHGAEVNARDGRGKTALFAVIDRFEGKTYDEPAVQLLAALLDAGADVNLRDASGQTPLDAANRNPRIARYLRTRGGEHGGFSASEVAAMSQTEKDAALGMLAEIGHFASVTILLAAGADADASGGLPRVAGKSRLTMAIPIMSVLIEAGADIDAQGRWDATALYWAVWIPEQAAFLLSMGADPNIAADYLFGEGPLHRAARGRDAETVKMLIEYGANVFAENTRGETPLDLAYDYGTRAMIALLETAEFENDSPAVAASVPVEGDLLAEELRKEFAEAFDAGPAFGDAFGAVGFSQPSFLGRLDSLMRESGGSGTESFSGWEYENEVGKVWASASERGDFGFGASDGDDALSGSLGGSPFAALVGNGMMAGGEVGFGNDVKGRVAVFGDYRTESFLQGDEKQWADWAVRGVNGDAIETAMDAAEKFSALADGRARTRGAMTELHFGGSDVGVAFQAGAIEESESVLAGTSRGEALRGLRSRTAFAGVSGSVPVFASGWRLRGAAHAGWSRAFSDGVLRTGSLWASAYSAGLERGGWLYSDDAFVLRFSQPLRVEDWEMELGDGSGAVRVLGAGPSGRQLDAEAAYRMPLSGGGWFLLSAGVRREGGHVRGNGTEGGAVFLVEREF